MSTNKIINAMEKKEDLEIEKAPEELTEQDLEKVTGGYTVAIDPTTCGCEKYSCDPIYRYDPCPPINLD